MGTGAHACSRGRGRFARAAAAAALVVLLLWPGWLRGHNGEPPPAPPTPPRAPLVPDVTRIYPPRWSWVHWWEANRDPYLQVLHQAGPGQRPEQDVYGAARGKAVAVLTAALQDNVAGVRVAAALALGRLGEKTAEAALLDAAAKETVPAARRLLLVALGLLDGPGAEQFLLAHPCAEESERLAVLVGVGLLAQPSAEGMKALERAHVGESVGAGTLAAWALEQQASPAVAVRLRTVMSQTTSPWLTSGALLALGRLGRAEDVPLLEKVLLGRREVMELPAWAKLQELHTGKLRYLAQQQAARAEFGDAYQRYLDNHRRFYGNTPNAPPPSAPAGIAGSFFCLRIGPEIILMADLRGSAAIALGRIDHPAARAALLEALTTRDTETYKGYGQLYKAHVIISLGQLGEEKAVPDLLAILDARSPRGALLRQDDAKSPLRGYAALALGLYSRPVVTPQGPVDRPNYAEACQALAERIADERETTEVRSACAVALGLTRRTENLRYLQAASPRVTERDEPLPGYLIQARGMLGDRNVLEPAARLLGLQRDPEPPRRQEIAGILSRRAAVLGLGLLGSEEVIPLLRKAWNLNYYENREVMLALAFSRAYGLTEELAEGIAKERDPHLRAYFACCLGEIFTPQRPPRLAAILNGSNYMLRNDKMLPYQGLGNEFLYEYLIAAFGKDWQ